MLKVFKKELEKNKKIFLKVKVLPGKPETKIIAVMNNGVIKINISPPPEKGRANKELIKFLSKNFNTKREKVKIISGKTDKIKLVTISL